MNSSPNGLREAVGAFASVALHVSVLGLAGFYAPAPSLDIDFQLPTEVEFGLTEAMTAAPIAALSPEPVVPPEPEPVADISPDGEGMDAGVADAQPDAEPESVADAEPEPAPEVDAGVGDAGPLVAAVDAAGADADASALAALESDGGAGPGGDGPSRIPPGAQLAIRLDLARVRASPLRTAVQELLSEIPDWQILLDGSELDPIEDLDRILLASPNLQRSRLIMAGRHIHDEAFARAAVARMASSQGRRAPWRTDHGVQVAPWFAHDETERVVALVGPQHFTVSRAEDLPRILALMAARGERDADEEGLEQARGADALLNLGEGEVVSFEVEGAQRFVRGRVDHIPERLRVGIREREDGMIELLGTAFYEDPAAAEEAATFWQAYLDQQSRSFLIRAVAGEALRNARITAEGRRLVFGTVATRDLAEVVLSYFKGRLRGARRDRARRNMPRTAPTMDSGAEATPSAMSASPMSASPMSPAPEARPSP